MNEKDNPQIHIAETMTVGIILERRDSDHPWQDHIWRVSGLLPGDTGGEGDWRQIKEGDGWTQFYAGTRLIELFRRETDGYKANLTNDPPLVFIVLRTNEEDDGRGEILPFNATVCPYEAQGYDGNDETVEGVAMPPEVAQWVSAYVERYHVDEPPFKKRKQKKKTAENAWGGKVAKDGGRRDG